MEILELFARCGLYMSLLVFVLYPLIALFGKRYSPHSIYVAWVIVLIGFVIPFRPCFTYDTSVETVDVPPAIVAPYPVTGRPIPNQPIPVDASVIQWTQILLLIWLIGFVATLGYHLVRNYLFYRTVKRWWNPPGDSRLLAIFDREKALIPSASNVKIMLCNTVNSPMLIGITKPVILLPEASIASTNIHLIIRHELIHYRRKDLWIKLLQVLAISLHWYNPVVYLLIRMVNTNCEISCDAAVLKSENRTECTAYCKAILEYAHDSSIVPMLSSSYSAGKRFLEKRFEAIMNSKTKRMGIVIATIVFVAVLITGATWAAEPKYDKSTYVSAEAAAEAEIEVSSAADALTEEQLQQTQRTFSSHQEFLETFEYMSIDLTDGQTPLHSVKNGELVVYTYAGEKWALTVGDLVTVSLEIDPILVDGHSTEIGYIMNNTYVELHHERVKNTASFEFEAPETGEYNFYLAGLSSDKIRVQSFVVDVVEATDNFFFTLPVSNVTAYPYVSEESGEMRLIFPCEDKTSIRASADGTVTKVVSGYTGYGKYIILDHGNGYTTLYAHNSELDVEVGDEVERGQVIARVGRTGRTTGYGLGFEIRYNGESGNPLDYVNLSDGIFDTDGYIFGISDEDRITVDKVLQSDLARSKMETEEGFAFFSTEDELLYRTPMK